MNQILQQKLHNLGINFLSHGAKRTNEYAICPKCKGDNDEYVYTDLRVNTHTGQFKCGKCNYSGNALYKKRDEYPRPTISFHELSNKAINWLRQRGLTDNTIRYLIDNKLICGSPRSEDMVIFIYNKNGEAINYKLRSIVDKSIMQQQSGGEKCLYNIDSVKGKDAVIVVEGEMCVEACIEAGLHNEFGVVSLENGASREGNVQGKLEGFRNCLDQMADVKKFIVALDNDEAGIYTANELIKIIGQNKVWLVDYPIDCKDADDIINRKKRGKYDHEVNLKTLSDVFKKAQPFPISGKVILNDNMIALLKQYKKLGRPKPINIPLFSTKFNCKSGEYTILSGYPGTGKSTVAMFIASIMILEYGWKFCIFAGEQYPIDRYFEDLASMILRKPIEEKDRFGNPINGCATDEEYETALEFISNHVVLINPEEGKPSLEWIMERVEEERVRNGCNGVILDTFNKMYHDMGGRDDKYMDDFHDKAIAYARNYDFFCLLMHPSKPMKTKNGTIPRMGSYDLAHGAMSYNKADNIIIIHRDDMYNADRSISNTAVFETAKIRDQKTTGRIGELELLYDSFRNTYSVNTLMYRRTLLESINNIMTIEEVGNIENDEIPF